MHDEVSVQGQGSSAITGHPASCIVDRGSHLPYGRQWIDDEDVRAVVDVLTSDYLTTGPKVAEFESALCSFTGARFACVVNSGTSALHAMYFAADLKAGDEIITTPMTFAATGNAALYLGATIRFVDVDRETGLIEPSQIADAISDKTKLIVPIDFTGHPADYDAIRSVSGYAKVVADAAHSLGATYKGRKVGTLCHATATSMHPVKPITTAEGGAVLTHDPVIAARAASFRTHGIIREPREMMNNEGAWWYEQHDLGFNYRLTDVQCALGVAQMRRLETFIGRRREIAKRYSSALRDSGLLLPKESPDVESGWHLYIVRVHDPSRRKAFFDRLRELGLGVQVHYIPVNWHPYYQFLGYERGLCPNAEDFYSRCVSLPLYPKMSEDDVDSSIERIQQAVKDVL